MPLDSRTGPSPEVFQEQLREVQRLAEALRSAIRLSTVSSRDVERALGMSAGYLTRVLSGQVHLRVIHVLGICREVGLPVGSLLAALFPAPPGAEDPKALALAQLHPPPVPPVLDPSRVFLDLRRGLNHLEVLFRQGSQERVDDREIYRAITSLGMSATFPNATGFSSTSWSRSGWEPSAARPTSRRSTRAAGLWRRSAPP